MAWSENDKKRALKAFRQVHPDWKISTNQKRCPQCAKQHPARRFGLNYCAAHHFANENWLVSGGIMIVLTGLRDRQLREALRAEGQWDYPSV
jgi:hypothetical protein